jgi:hypothetical protein
MRIYKHSRHSLFCYQNHTTGNLMAEMIPVIAVKIPPLAMSPGCWVQGAEENDQA